MGLRRDGMSTRAIIMTGMLVFGITYVVVSLVSGEDVYKALRVAVIGFALAGLVYIFSGRVARHR